MEIPHIDLEDETWIESVNGQAPFHIPIEEFVAIQEAAKLLLADFSSKVDLLSEVRPQATRDFMRDLESSSDPEAWLLFSAGSPNLTAKFIELSKPDMHSSIFDQITIGEASKILILRRGLNIPGIPRPVPPSMNVEHLDEPKMSLSFAEYTRSLTGVLRLIQLNRHTKERPSNFVADTIKRLQEAENLNLRFRLAKHKRTWYSFPEIIPYLKFES